MEQELEQLDIKMKDEIRTIKDKYATIKKEIRNKYKSENQKIVGYPYPRRLKIQFGINVLVKKPE